MAGLSFDAHLSLETAGLFRAVSDLVLVIKARSAVYSNYRRTELRNLPGRELEFLEHRAEQMLGGAVVSWLSRLP